MKQNILVCLLTIAGFLWGWVGTIGIALADDGSSATVTQNINLLQLNHLLYDNKRYNVRLIKTSDLPKLTYQVDSVVRVLGDPDLALDKSSASVTRNLNSIQLGHILYRNAQYNVKLSQVTDFPHLVYQVDTIDRVLGAPNNCLPAAGCDDGDTIQSTELIDNQGYPFPADLVSDANQTQKANYAWRLFIASMQQTTATLSSGVGRGLPDGTHDFIDTGHTPTVTNPLVIESLYHRTEAYPYYKDTKPASPIDQVPTYHTFYDESGNKMEKTLVAGPDEGQGQYVYLDETNQISQNFLYYQDSNNPDFPVLYMAKVNAIETNYALNDARESPSSTKSWDFPSQTIEVKTGWRRVSDIKSENSDPDNYHQATATYWTSGMDGVPTLETDTFALIAVHIIQKTANFPEFIFTTFEHINAVTRDDYQVITDPAYKTQYNKLSYQSPDSGDHTATANGAYDINEEGQQPAQLNTKTTYTLPAAGDISIDFTTVVQPKTIISEVNDVNNQVNALIRSLDTSNIWANYRLKGVQAGPTSDSESSNYYLANIVVESSQPGIQLFSGILLNGGVPKYDYLVNCRGDIGSTTCVYPGEDNTDNPITYNNVSTGVVQNAAVPTPTENVGGCQGCHGAAQQLGRDFSFLANGVLGNGKELDSVPNANLTIAQKAALNKRIALRATIN